MAQYNSDMFRPGAVFNIDLKRSCFWRVEVRVVLGNPGKRLSELISAYELPLKLERQLGNSG